MARMESSHVSQACRGPDRTLVQAPGGDYRSGPEMGFTVEGNAPRAAAANKITRAGKSPDNDPEIRHRRWRGEAEGYVEREVLIASILGKSEEITQELIRALTEVLEDLPYRLTREEAVFRLPDIVERVGNATAGLLNHDAVATSIERVILSPEVVRLTRPPRSAEGRSDMAHTRLYSTRHNYRWRWKSGTWRQAWPPIRDIPCPPRPSRQRWRGC